MVLGTLAVALLAPFAWLSYRSHSSVVELDRFGHETSGQVVGTQCENHGRMYYKFEVAGKSFGGDGACLSSCRSARAGDTVRVIYASANPANSSCEPRSHLHSKARGNYIGVGLGAAVLAVLVFYVTRKKNLGLS
jgi:hypothetical protein